MNEPRERIRTIMRTMYDFQDMRVRMANRLKKRKDGSDQDAIDEVNLEDTSIPVIVETWQDSQRIERNLAKALEEELKEVPIYTAFLKDVKGCGPLMAAVIVAEFDIYIATTVSKMWQFAGLNPGMVRGMKARGSKKDGTFETYKTDDLVRGDRRTPGYLSPFNGFLRTKLVGVLAASFLKCNSPYRKYYDDYKQRLEHEDSVVNGGEKAWKDESKGHRNNAAKRYMIKMFLADLYDAWRKVEGLPVRAPYHEEKLGHEHTA